MSKSKKQLIDEVYEAAWFLNTYKGPCWLSDRIRIDIGEVFHIGTWQPYGEPIYIKQLYIDSVNDDGSVTPSRRYELEKLTNKELDMLKGFVTDDSYKTYYPKTKH